MRWPLTGQSSKDNDDDDNNDNNDKHEKKSIIKFYMNEWPNANGHSLTF